MCFTLATPGPRILPFCHSEWGAVSDLGGSYCAKYCLFLTKGAALLADITKKVPIYVHFVEKLQTFDLRALGGSFCRKFGRGAVHTFL